MQTHPPLRNTVLCVTALLLAACGGADKPMQHSSVDNVSADSSSNAAVVVAEESAQPTSIAKQIDGLWMYTGLTTSDGNDLPLTGVFLFKDGVFLQQAVFDNDAFETAGAMAHAGPAKPEPETGSVHLVAEQTISITPTSTPPLSFQRDTEHDVTVSRDGDDLTLIFGMGTSTVQEFRYVGPGQGQIHELENGALAFVDGYFILVDGDEDGATTAYGTFEKQDAALTLNVIRWSQTDGTETINLKDTVINASFDGESLELEDGRSFPTS